ncbi:MAG: hypothetical protein NT027_18620 [Proteobacteria bacterium]|nr:hypothetical protein [Pseudomonadota bacterium]
MGAIEKLIQGESIQTGITLNGGRDCRLRIKREPDTSGFEIYIIENLVRKEMIKVPRYLFEFFKVGVQKSISQMNDQDFADVIVEFKGKVKIRFEKSKAIGLRVVACDDREVASGSLQLNSVILKHLLDLLNDERIGQGSDILKRILAYHRLFKFTFSEATDSLNSGLSLRTDVLSQVEDYVPPVGKRTARLNLNDFLKSDSASTQVVSKVGKNDLAQDKKSEHKVFKSRLAERDGGRAWKVDYQALFSQNIQRSFDRQPKANSGEENKKEGSPRHAWLIPLLSSEVKLGAKKWRCELSSEDILTRFTRHLVGS